MDSGKSAKGEALVAFVHIPKTAGTTLASFLRYQYAQEEIYGIHRNGSSKQLRRFKAAMKKKSHELRLVQGHFDLSLNRWLPSDTRYFTMLRDPVERAISHYFHYRRLATDPIHPMAMNSTLSQWVASRGLTEMDNGQTRRLAGKPDIPIGEVTRETLRAAKANLRKFAVVGLTERFEESQVLLHQAFDWPRYRYPSRNVGENRVRRDELGSTELNTIMERNRYDLELYEFARETFEHSLTSVDMQSELALLAKAPIFSPPTRIVAKPSEKPAQSAILNRIRSLFAGTCVRQGPP